MASDNKQWLYIALAGVAGFAVSYFGLHLMHKGHHHGHHHHHHHGGFGGHMYPHPGMMFHHGHHHGGYGY